MKNCIICQNKLTTTQVKYCSNNCKQKAHYNKHKTNTNSTYSQYKRGVERKLELVNSIGGVCSKCGYNKNLAALHFHHLKDKKFGIDIRKISNTKMLTLKEEVVKCILLCANCHAEEHNPHMNISSL